MKKNRAKGVVGYNMEAGKTKKRIIGDETDGERWTKISFHTICNVNWVHFQNSFRWQHKQMWNSTEELSGSIIKSHSELTSCKEIYNHRLWKFFQSFCKTRNTKMNVPNLTFHHPFWLAFFSKKWGGIWETRSCFLINFIKWLVMNLFLCFLLNVKFYIFSYVRLKQNHFSWISVLIWNSKKVAMWHI